MAQNLKWFGKKVLKKVNQGTETVLDKGCIMIINTAKALMREPKTGIEYKGKAYKTRASAPGQAPAVQTGRLRASLHWLTKTLSRLIGTNLPVGFFLEVGTSKMAARPYLRPSFKKNAQRIVKMLKGIV